MNNECQSKKRGSHEFALKELAYLENLRKSIDAI
jgi:hypothetical protein